MNAHGQQHITRTYRPCVYTAYIIIHLKNLVRSPSGIYPTGWGQKPLIGTDFELWMNMSLQQNKISTITKKLVNLQGLPYIPPIWWTLVQERLRTVGKFLPTPKFSHWETLSVDLPPWPNG